MLFFYIRHGDPIYSPDSLTPLGRRQAEALGRRGIALRAGLHCAPLAHRTAGTLDTGTVRLSLSDFNTPAQIEKLAQELHQLFRETVR